MTPKPQLILFDMDNTLLDVGVYHRKALHETLKTIFSFDAQHDGMRHPGHTQPEIMVMICRDQGLPEVEIQEKLAESMHHLSQTVIGFLPQDLKGAVLPGVHTLLTRLREKGHILGIVTGSLTTTATTLLIRTGLEHYFPITAFGDEADNRPDLIQLAMKKADDLFGESWRSNGLVTIGDAAGDLKAGRQHGARTVSVATGYQNKDYLATHKPDALLDDFTDIDETLEAILHDKNPSP